MQCGVGDNDLKKDWMPCGEGDELAKRIVLGYVVEDEVATHITSNYHTRGSISVYDRVKSQLVLTVSQIFRLGRIHVLDERIFQG